MADLETTVRNNGRLRLERAGITRRRGSGGVTTRLRRCLVPAALLPALALLASCGSSTPVELGEVLRATIVVEVTPNPVSATQNAVTFGCTASYEIKISEVPDASGRGLGGEVLSVSSAVYDPASGKLVGQTVYDSADMTVFVGSKRVNAGDSLSFKHQVSYTLPDLTKAAPLTVAVQFKDDRGNVIHTSTLVQIQ